MPAPQTESADRVPLCVVRRYRLPLPLPRSSLSLRTRETACAYRRPVPGDSTVAACSCCVVGRGGVGYLGGLSRPSRRGCRDGPSCLDGDACVRDRVCGGHGRLGDCGLLGFLLARVSLCAWCQGCRQISVIQTSCGGGGVRRPFQSA